MSLTMNRGGRNYTFTRVMEYLRTASQRFHLEQLGRVWPAVRDDGCESEQGSRQAFKADGEADNLSPIAGDPAAGRERWLGLSEVSTV